MAKKKIKDFTLGEWKEICDKKPKHCPFRCAYCPIVFMTREHLEQEIEVEDEK